MESASGNTIETSQSISELGEIPRTILPLVYLVHVRCFSKLSFRRRAQLRSNFLHRLVGVFLPILALGHRRFALDAVALFAMQFRTLGELVYGAEWSGVCVISQRLHARRGRHRLRLIIVSIRKFHHGYRDGHNFYLVVRIASRTRGWIEAHYLDRSDYNFSAFASHAGQGRRICAENCTEDSSRLFSLCTTFGI